MLDSRPMSAIRLPLLCAFAGGCLSSAVLFAFWSADSTSGAPAEQPRARTSGFVAASLVTPNADQRHDASHDSASPTAPDEPGHVAASAPSREATGEPLAARDTSDVASAVATPGSSAVSDVLTDLEAAYRQRLIAAARAEAEAAPTAVTQAAVAQLDPAREVAAQAVAPVVPVSAPAPAVALAAPAVAAPAVAAAAPAAAAPAPEPAATAAPALVAQNDVRPPDVHIGDINQNTYNITNVRQGDVYVTQQLAMLQYMQLLGMATNPGLTQPAHIGRGAVQHSAPQFRQFPSTLTNPDNPWGFTFAPPNLVH